jgi:hypothetical protein
MKRFIIGTVVLVSISIASITQTVAQPRFEVPLKVTDGVAAETLYFGFFPGAHYCFDPADTLNGHGEGDLSPFPPSGIFEARFVRPRSGPNDSCVIGGSSCDFRPPASSTQRDTFRLKCQLGSGTTMIILWPAGLSSYFTGLTLRFFDGSGNVGINMLTDSTADVSDAGDPAVVTILSGGLVVTSVTRPSSALPGEFALNQNYPNPFNPSTRIRFSVPGTGYVSLKVFDLLGKEITTLVEGKQERGEHSVEWKAEGLPSGVYICRLTTAGSTVSRKVLLLR